MPRALNSLSGQPEVALPARGNDGEGLPAHVVPTWAPDVVLFPKRLKSRGADAPDHGPTADPSQEPPQLNLAVAQVPDYALIAEIILYSEAPLTVWFRHQRKTGLPYQSLQYNGARGGSILNVCGGFSNALVCNTVKCQRAERSVPCELVCVQRTDSCGEVFTR